MLDAWRAGMHGQYQGFQWRTSPGYKGRGDLRLDIRTRNQRRDDWCAVPMALGFLLADFFYDNEERVHPPRLYFRGGEYYLDHLLDAVCDGWESQALLVEDQRRRKRQRDQ